MTNKIIQLFVISYIVCSCSQKTNTVASFPQELELAEIHLSVNKDSLGRVEGIQCNDSLLTVWDFNLGKSFTLFNTHTGDCYGRFGTTGQGPTEIPLPSFGYISQGKYKIFNCSIGYIGQYDLASLCLDTEQVPEVLCRKSFNDDLFCSAIHPINDSLYLGAGVYNSKDQYVLFDNKERVIHSKTLIYNAFNDLFNKANKILSNQGRMTKAPDSDKFAFFLINSTNIDFLEVIDNIILEIKLLRERDPGFAPIQEGTASWVYPDKNSSIGYIDVASGNNFVYALYTDKKINQAYSSDIIKVFDWQGNPSKQFKLTHEAYYIAVDETNNRLYAAIKEEDGGWNIIAYDTRDIQT